MSILKIPVKFQNRDKVYTIKQEKLEIDCHICEGTKQIKYNDKDMKCPECMGVGKFISNKNIYIVCDEPFTISSTKISINSNGVTSVKYKGYSGYNSLNRAEENLFLTQEEAQSKCDWLNKERVSIDFNDIIIQESFKNTHPSIDKMIKKLDYYKKYNRFDNDIIINKDNVLINGYINYLLCKTLNKDLIKVVVDDSINECTIIEPNYENILHDKSNEDYWCIIENVD
jgi:hypothetical protein